MRGPFHLNRRNYHNSVDFRFKEDALDGPSAFARQIETSLLPAYADFAYIADANEEDVHRYAEAYRPRACRQFFAQPHISSPSVFRRARQVGNPYVVFYSSARGDAWRTGWLWDVAWYNYFGKPYVDLIGKDRLSDAGWARTSEVGDGLACYATDKSVLCRKPHFPALASWRLCRAFAKKIASRRIRRDAKNIDNAQFSTEHSRPLFPRLTL